MGEAAANALLRNNHEGKSYELTASKSYTFADIAQALSERSKKPVPYVSPDPQSFEDRPRQPRHPRARCSGPSTHSSLTCERDATTSSRLTSKTCSAGNRVTDRKPSRGLPAPAEIREQLSRTHSLVQWVGGDDTSPASRTLKPCTSKACSKKETSMPRKRRSFAQRVLAAPTLLYRAGLGWIMTERYLMIEHTGRRTGHTRRTIVECVQKTPEGGVIVASALGEKGAWFLNVRYAGKARIFHGRRRYDATAKVVEPKDRSAPLTAFATAHPKAANLYARRYRTEGEPDTTTIADYPDKVLLVEFQPAHTTPTS
ncbi:nitroreductase family deazaflavin-dependent oxidoreductase [Streptomyces acidicola]|uniref:nitroreductase family deazaflavin-dependent oxidoreductase n=1 Tax=Streptomyces acidicola TaxID=2596892 RepID=UPI003818D858